MLYEVITRCHLFNNSLCKVFFPWLAGFYICINGVPFGIIPVIFVGIHSLHINGNTKIIALKANTLCKIQTYLSKNGIANGNALSYNFV